MLLLGMLELKKDNEKQLVEVKGFDVLGFFFPFIRLAVAGMWGKFALFCVTFYVYPIWAWYIGFNFKQMKFRKLLSQGWTITEEERKVA